MAKTIKVLSDGTIAKVGMIIARPTYGRISKILSINKPEDTGNHITTDYEQGAGYKGKWSAFCPNYRKATAEERKIYYQQLNSK